ncbi:hypothetical protein [Anaerorhabdus sp.]|jgi:hypothetical protein|uniref:hypothetical protein n=1 Tax=Anaerorhabdus sp. TaxID=1872524 RepID=UPI002FC9BF41
MFMSGKGQVFSNLFEVCKEVFMFLGLLVAWPLLSILIMFLLASFITLPISLFLGVF